MKALFVHDHKFKTLKDKVYTTGSLNSNIWARYLTIFDYITVVARDAGEIKDNPDNYRLSSLNKVDFVLLPNLSNVKSEIFGNKQVSKQCKELVAFHDALIVRLPSKLGYLFIKEAIKQKKPFAVEVVGSAWDALWNYGGIKGKIYAPLADIRTKLAVYKAPFVIYVTESFLQKRYPCKNGKTTFCSDVEINEVDEAILNQRLLKIQKPSKKIIFGLIGHYTADYKGIDVAIKALAHISSQLPDWEFQIVGSGDPEKYLNLAKDLGVDKKVNFVGKIASGEAVFNWLDSIDVYLQPSLVEGLPRALIEAMSRGCPSIGSNVGGIPELLTFQQICKSGDFVDLAEKINSTVSSQQKMTILAKTNFKKASAYYKHTLNERRNIFWQEFKKYVESKAN